MKVSIIIPAFNAEETIKRAIDSVKAQTYTDWECIIIDDGSTDNTGRIIADETIYCTGFHFWSLEHNCGVARTRNYAMQVVNGDAIFFLDADDYMEPDCIERLVRHLEEHPMAGRAFTPPVIHWPDGRETEWTVRYRGLIPPDTRPFSEGCDYGHVTGSLYRVDYLPFKYHFQDVPCYEDLLFNIGLVFAGVTTYVTMDSLYHYCRHSNSITHGDFSIEDGKKVAIAFAELVKKYNPTPEIATRCQKFLLHLLHQRLGEKFKYL